MAEKSTGKSKAQEDVVFVGNKPAMSYVLACVTQFNNGNKQVHLKARGKSISRAVDVAEIVRNRFVTDSKIDKVDIGTEEIETDDGNKVNVSGIDITLTK